MEVSNSSILEETQFNTTEHRGFLHGFVESFSVILVILTYSEDVHFIRFFMSGF